MARSLLLFDADCGFCRWSVDRVLAWDRGRRLHAVPLQHPHADRLLPGIDPEAKMSSWHLVSEGRVYSGGAAVPPLFRLLPGGRPLAALAAAFPGATERAYRWVSRRRAGIGSTARARCDVGRK
jgi:predicted DCC family thiol-disulfide oxidoreductase YuxK